MQGSNRIFDKVFHILYVVKLAALLSQIRRATDAGNDIDCRQLNKKKKRKGKGKGKNGSNSGIGDDDDEMEGINGLSPEKQLTCSLILQELNNKMKVVAWKPT